MDESSRASADKPSANTQSDISTNTGANPEPQIPSKPVAGSQTTPLYKKHYKAPRTVYQPFDLEKYLQKMRFCPAAENYITQAFEQPSRPPSGYFSNTVRYPSQRFGYTVTSESRGFEFPFVLTAVHRPEVLAVLEQPPQLVIKGHTKDGTPFTITHTPDFLIITPTGVEIHEVKPVVEIATLCLKHPNRYQEKQGQRGTYDSKPVREFFARWNFVFSIETERNLNGTFVKNAAFLHPYVTGASPSPITSEEFELFVGAVRNTPGIQLSAIPIENPSRRAELVFHFLAKAEIFTHLSDADFQHPQTIRLYPSPRDEYAFQQFLKGTRLPAPDLAILGYRLKLGSLVEVDGVDYKVTSLTAKNIELQPEEGEPRKLTHRQLLDLSPRIGNFFNADRHFRTLYAAASEEDRVAYLYYKNAIKPYLDGGNLAGKTPKDRTTRRKLAEFRKGELDGQGGDYAIFPKYINSGDHRTRFPEDVEAEIKRLVEEKYLSTEKPKAQFIRDLLVAKFGQTKAPEEIPDARTIYRRLARIDRYKSTYARMGKRQAEKYRHYHYKNKIALPAHGQKAWDYAQIDCSKIDMANAEGKKLIEACMVDAFSGKVLASVIWEGAPNWRLIRALILKCLETHGTLPAMIVYDWGTENNTTWMETSMAEVGITCHIRPKAAPRSGAPVESNFSVKCRTLLEGLAGNTELLKHARLCTAAVNPAKLALWTTESLLELIAEYYRLRNDLPRKDKASPDAIELECSRVYGEHPRIGLSAEELRKVLLPIVPGTYRTVSPRGSIRVFGKTFAHVDLRKFAGKEVLVREDPDDRTRVHAIPLKRRSSIPCTICGRGFEDEEILEAAKKHDEAKVSSMPGIPYADAKKAEFAAKTDATQQRLKEEKQKRKTPPPKSPPIKTTTTSPTNSSAKIFTFERFSK